MLDGLRVLDLCDGSGAHCGRILADLGADVIKVEPPAGDPTRAIPPYLDDVPGPDRGLLHLALNANKRGVTLDLDDPNGRELLRRLVDVGDVLVESFAPGYLEERGLGYAALSARNDRLIVTSITPYGQDGPLAGLPASDLEVTAASGSLWLGGEPREPPVRTTLPQSPFWTGMYAAAGTLFAYLVRERLGRGQHVDVSAQASMVTVHPPASVFADVLGEEHVRLGPYLVGRSIVGTRFRNVWPCRDGYVAFAIQGGPIGRHTGRMLEEWMRARGMRVDAEREIDWDTFDNRTLTQADVDRMEAAIGAFFLTLTKAEFFEGVLARNMLGYPVSTAEDVYADEQLRARDFWQEVPLAADSALTFPGGFAVFGGERPRIRRPAPRVGEHSDEVYRELLGLNVAELAALRERAIL